LYLNVNAFHKYQKNNTMINNKLFFCFFLTFLINVFSSAQTLFIENMGNPENAIPISNNTFENSGILNYSNGSQLDGADITSTDVSNGYTGSSAGGNVFFSSTNGAYGFSIEGINATNVTSLTLQFGYKKESASSHASFAVDYWNGNSWVNIANTPTSLFNESASASAVWYLSKSLSLPIAAQINGLKIRFVKTGSIAIRIDDVTLTANFPPTSSSDVVLNSSSSNNSNSNIDYSLYQGSTLTNTGTGSGGSIGVMGFYLRDGGASLSDADNLGTQLSSISFEVTNWQNIKCARLFQGNSPRGTVINVTNSTLAFTGINDIIAADNTQIALSLRITYNGEVVDNQKLEFTISSLTAANTGTNFSTSSSGVGISSVTSGDINRIEVMATKLVFLQQPRLYFFPNANMNPNPSVCGYDSFNNLDLDFSGSVTLTSSGILSGSLSAQANNGIATFSHVNHTTAGNGLVLIASSPGLLSGNSNLFYITPIADLIDTSLQTQTPFGIQDTHCEPTICNLVINGDFEQINGTLVTQDNIDLACGWGRIRGTPDLFNTASTGNTGVPCNIMGDQTSNNNQGNGYAGIGFIDNTGEVMGTRLAAPLIAGQTYILRYDVSLAESNSSFSKTVQAYLSPVAVANGTAPIPITNPLSFFSPVSTSTVSNGWESISFTFIATGGEEFLYLGGLQNVLTASNTFTLSVNCNHSNNNQGVFLPLRLSYYYIDNVSIVSTVPTLSPNFSSTQLFAPICLNGPVPQLPATDDNGVAGTWSPATVSNTATTSYTFTPTNNSCITPQTYTIEVLQNCGFTISSGSEVSCQKAIEGGRPFDNDIEDGPCLRVCENSQINYELHGNLNLILNTEWIVTGGTKINETNSSCDVLWGNGSFCSLQVVINLINGTQLYINRCIEKLEAPVASFSVFPQLPNQTYTSCVNLPINFSNYSQVANGNDVLYYNWSFGDGTHSTDFEPSHTYQNPGSYTVHLVVTNGCSCISETAATIEILEGSIPIECPSVACQGAVAQYSVLDQYAGCTDLNWQVEGGIIQSTSADATKIVVLWNNVSPEGFGTVSLTTNQCSNCITKIKVPVVLQNGTIEGSQSICSNKSQAVYQLPQWPTTDFNWSINDNGTGAFLILSPQRNQVIVQTFEPGTIDLYCTYQNTLLGCGGTAHYVIQVKPDARINGNPSVCANTPSTYTVTEANNGNQISTVNWFVNGPGVFQEQGSTGQFDITFPISGMYTITISDPNYCLENVFEVEVKEVPQAPSSIVGPLVICPGEPITYSCTPPDGETAVWAAVNGTILGTAYDNNVTINFSPSATTPYTINLYYEKMGCRSTTLETVVMRDVPTITVTQNDAFVCGSSYGNYAIQNVNADSYTWSIVPATAGSIQTGQNTPSITILWNQQPQTASVRLSLKKCGRVYNLSPNAIAVTISNSPTITITGDATVCAETPASFSFSQIPTGTFTTVTWNFGDGTPTETSSTNTIIHNYANPTTANINYTITATVSGVNGCVADGVATYMVTVSPSPIITLSPLSDLNLCSPYLVPSDYIFAVVMQGGFAQTDEITWFKNNVGILNGTGPLAATINLQPLGIGQYYAAVTNDYGCTKNTRVFSVYNNCPSGGGTCISWQPIDFDITPTGCKSIVAQATSVPGTPIGFNWQLAGVPAGSTSSNNIQLNAQDLPIGEYRIDYEVIYFENNQNCTARKIKTFIIPYEANLKYEVSCNANGTYTVTLLDFSKYYPTVPITEFWFTVDDGTYWYNGSLNSNNVQQFTTSLSPGTHNIGIRIQNPNYPTCQKIVSLVLPALPIAQFTCPASACANTPIQFTLTNYNPNNRYLWTFQDGAQNLQPNPVKTYGVPNPYDNTLTVTNPFGCTATLTKTINIFPINMGGLLAVSPPTVCEGGQKTISFNSTGLDVPVEYAWYKNNVTPTPYAVTTSPNLTVNENGRYLPYLTDSNGCQFYDVNAVSVGFIAPPPLPLIQGNSKVCVNTSFTLQLPIGTATYEWSKNGDVQSQWLGLHTVTDVVSTPGFYTYTVVAKIQVGNTTCTSSVGTKIVEVLAPPAAPEIAFGQVSCSPYRAIVNITNPQSGVGYYWSNGFTGNTTTLLHDGPLQAKAVLNECVSKAQIDLPVDSNKYLWIVPKGCYRFCNEPQGSVLGPLGDFASWAWQQSGQVVAQNQSSGVDPLTTLIPENYNLVLDNGFCSVSSPTLSIQNNNCSSCEFGFESGTISCLVINNQRIYQLEATFSNPYPNPIWVNITAPNGEGYFSNNSIQIAPGVSSQTFFFVASLTFQGGIASLTIEGNNNGTLCSQEREIEFPNGCTFQENCLVTHALQSIRCVKVNDPSRYVYSITIRVTNPYPFPVQFSLSVNAGVGTFLPSSVMVNNGSYDVTFYMTSINSAPGNSIDITLLTSLGSLTCQNRYLYDLPQECPDIPVCDIPVKIDQLTCTPLPNHPNAYTLLLSYLNTSNGMATLILTSANGGPDYFEPSVLSYPPGNTAQTVVYYPESGFAGGGITIQQEAYLNNGTVCERKLEWDLPPCCPTCKAAGAVSSKPATSYLVAAPNPTHSSTTVVYDYPESTSEMQLELTDVLGRKLQEWQLTSSKGNQEIDLTRYAHGYYIVVLKQHHKPLDSIQLIKN
jgi:PKD repeat protein